MYVGCFLQATFSKVPNVFVNQKTRSSICFKTRDWAFQTLGWAFEALFLAFQKFSQAFVALRENWKPGLVSEKLDRMFVL